MPKASLFSLIIQSPGTEDGRLHYAGRAGTGMTEKELNRLAGILALLHVSKMPLAEPPPRDSRFGSPLKLSRVHWVRPKVVVEVTYLTWTEATFCGRCRVRDSARTRHHLRYISEQGARNAARLGARAALLLLYGNCRLWGRVEAHQKRQPCDNSCRLVVTGWWH